MAILFLTETLLAITYSNSGAQRYTCVTHTVPDSSAC